LGYVHAVYKTLGTVGTSAGAFRLRIDSVGCWPRLIEWGVRLRSSCARRPYGDQALFMTRDVFYQCDGFPDLPFMEDYVLLDRLHSIGNVRVNDLPVTTSARRWASRGWLRTTAQHQFIILKHLLWEAPSGSM